MLQSGTSNTVDKDVSINGIVTASTPFTLDVYEKGTLAFQTSGTWTGTVIIEASLDNITWRTTTFVALLSGHIPSTFSSNISGQIDCVGLRYIRFRSNNISSGQVDIVSIASRLTSNVMLDNSIPAGNNNIGSINNITGTVSLPTGASTSAMQNTANTSLNNIDTDLGTTADTAWSGTGNASLISVEKGIFGKLNTDANGNLKVNTSATTFTYSPNNSTNGASTLFALANSATWNGTLENTINQPYLVTSVNSNRNVTLTVLQFIDAAGTIKAVPDIIYNVTANIAFPFPLAVQGNFIRLSVTNNSGSDANLYVDSYYGSLPVQPSRLSQGGNFKTSVEEQQVITSPIGVNSSTTQLAAGATFTGAWEAVLNTASAQVTVQSNQNCTIHLDQSIVAGGVPKTTTFTRTAGNTFSESILITSQFFRVRVVNNGGAATTDLNISTIYTPIMGQGPSAPTNLGNSPSAISEVGGVAVPATGILVTGRTGQPTATPTVTASSAYTAGNLVGGLMTFTNCFATGLTSGVLQSIVIRARSVQSATFKLYIFSQQPTNTTWTDKTAPNINVLDLPFLIDIFLFAAPDSGLGTMTIYTQDGLGKSIANTANGQNLWGLLVTTGTPTFASASDISVTLGLLQD